MVEDCGPPSVPSFCHGVVASLGQHARQDVRSNPRAATPQEPSLPHPSRDFMKGFVIPRGCNGSHPDVRRGPRNPRHDQGIRDLRSFSCLFRSHPTDPHSPTLSIRASPGRPRPEIKSASLNSVSHATPSDRPHGHFLPALRPQGTLEPPGFPFGYFYPHSVWHIDVKSQALAFLMVPRIESGVDE